MMTNRQNAYSIFKEAKQKVIGKSLKVYTS